MNNLDYNKPEFSVKYVSFDGPEDYTIIYPHGNRELLVCAKYLRNYFLKNDGVAPEIKSDAAACCENEILIGNTNRYETKLSEKEFGVSLLENRLVFEGGHRVMAEKAVKWFMTLERRSGKVATIKGKAEDFHPYVIIDGDKYNYVWGDEFDGDFLDSTKLCRRSHMPNHSKNVCVLNGENATLKVEDGLMKMSAINYNDEADPEIKYAVPECVCTDDTLWWLYGYVEIRAKLPMKKGSWPAWWATSYCDTKKGKTDGWKYLAEIDFFEVFSNDRLIQPNIHKWYKNYAGNFTELTDEEGRELRHNGYADLKLPTVNYTMPEGENGGFHTYGFKWSPTEMVMSVDGEDYMRYDLNFNFDGLTDMEDFIKQPLHMIFDNWIYAPGGWMAWEGNWISPESLPAEFFVEYIRLYQKNGEGYIVNSGVKKEI